MRFSFPRLSETPHSLDKMREPGPLSLSTFHLLEKAWFYMGLSLATLLKKKKSKWMSKFKIYFLFPDGFCLTEVSAGKFFLLPEIDIFILIHTYVCILIYPFFAILGLHLAHRVLNLPSLGVWMWWRFWVVSPFIKEHTYQHQSRAVCRHFLISFFSSERTN